MGVLRVRWQSGFQRSEGAGTNFVSSAPEWQWSVPANERLTGVKWNQDGEAKATAYRWSR